MCKRKGEGPRCVHHHTQDRDRALATLNAKKAVLAYEEEVLANPPTRDTPQGFRYSAAEQRKRIKELKTKTIPNAEARLAKHEHLLNLAVQAKAAKDAREAAEREEKARQAALAEAKAADAEPVKETTIYQVAFTEQEFAAIDRRRGSKTRTDYLYSQVFSPPTTFTNRIATKAQADEIKAHRGIVRVGAINEHGIGRPTTTKDTKRKVYAKLSQTSIENKAANLFVNKMAEAYDYDNASAYMRRAVMDEDLYDTERDRGWDRNSKRIEFLQARQEEFGLPANPTAEDVAQFKRAYDDHARAEAWKAVEEEYGTEVVEKLRAKYQAQPQQEQAAA